MTNETTDNRAGHVFTPAAIPESLRRQLSRAGKKGAAKLTDEARSRGGQIGKKALTREVLIRAGKASWAARLRRAREAEEAAKRRQSHEPKASQSHETPTNFNPSLKTGEEPKDQ